MTEATPVTAIVTNNSAAEPVLDADQQAAIEAGCDISRRIVPITGAAGTGKTLVIRRIYDTLADAGYSVALAAPTGKAAKRIKESTGYEAQTLHRLLGYGMPTEVFEEDETTGVKTRTEVSTGPKYGRNNPLPYDVIIVDEYAMVNKVIHSELMAAVKAGGRVIVLGDVNQLKPVEPGANFRDRDKDLSSSFELLLQKFDGIELKTVHRQTGDSGIAENCARILRREAPKEASDFHITITDHPVNALRNLLLELQEDGKDFASTDVQVITLQKSTWVGIEKLNAMMQTLVWRRNDEYLDLPRHPEYDSRRGEKVHMPDIRVQVGTKVICTANTYDLNDEAHSSVFNGEVGVVTAIDSVEGTLSIDFGDRELTIPPLIITQKDDGKVVETDPRKNIALAYALTTHKMQGSECKTVIVVLNKSTAFMQGRPNFYTACSRARNECFVISDRTSLRKSVVFPPPAR